MIAPLIHSSQVAKAKTELERKKRRTDLEEEPKRPNHLYRRTDLQSSGSARTPNTQPFPMVKK